MYSIKLRRKFYGKYSKWESLCSPQGPVVGTTFNWGSLLFCVKRLARLALKAYTEFTLLIRFNLVINKYGI